MNDAFKESMKNLLGARFDEFERAYGNKPRHKALRVNTLKISVDDFVSLARKIEGAGVREYGLRENALCAQSFYTCVKPSQDPLYHAGLYYMQEPSAAAAVAAFAPYIKGNVLDLCAAPGGKSTQAAAFMTGHTLFCNEPDAKRAHALAENLDRLGVNNAVVTVGDAKAYLDAGYKEYFDTLIVDAPCSGGGMMRYEDVPYSANIVAGCAARQREILSDAAELLKRGGYMLYSTCTFSLDENEKNVEYLVERHGFSTVDIPLRAGEERGVDCPDARRVYPHNFDGEGHFYCVLQKKTGGEGSIDCVRVKSVRARVGVELDCFNVFGRDVVERVDVKTDGLRLLRVGAEVWERTPPHAGEKKAKTYSHAFTHALTAEQIEVVGAVELDGENAERYIRGEQLALDAPRGELIATACGYALGKVKSAPDGSGGSALKNLYPKALRI